MTYGEALAYLDRFVNYERTHDAPAMRAVKLERMQQLCRQLGEPQRRFRSVLVAGTNGKGSICAMLYAMLRVAGLRTGLYLSPHLEDIRERIRVADGPPGRPAPADGDDWIYEDAFAAGLTRLQPLLEGLRQGPEGSATYFEVLTALALLEFARRRVEIAVLEVGLGGRLDATNVVPQTVSVFGPIDLDHLDVLGTDPVLIAREKAGILKAGSLAVTVPQADVIDEVLTATCEARGIPLWRGGRELTAHVEAETLDGLRVTLTAPRGIYESVALPLLGRHQAQNAVAAVAALEALADAGVPHRAVTEGLAQVRCDGRLEVVHREPLVLLDGAHNPGAARALRTTVQTLCAGRPVHLLLGMSADKALAPVLEALVPWAVSVTCTQSRSSPRAMDPTRLANHVRPLCADVHIMSDPLDAYTYLLNAVDPADVVVVTGSLFLVGDVRRALRRASVRPRAAQPAST